MKRILPILVVVIIILIFIFGSEGKEKIWNKAIDAFVTLCREHGIPGALLVVLVLYLIVMQRSTQKRLINQMQDEIDRLAADNRLYRDTYLKNIGFKENDDES